MLDSHFNTTLHLMTAIAYKSDEELNSESLSRDIGTNPAFLRKIMAKLSRAGLLHTKRGKSGGVSLARHPKDISLREIYLAVHGHSELSGPKREKSTCPVACSMQGILVKLSRQLERTQLMILGRIKLSHLMKEIKT